MKIFKQISGMILCMLAVFVLGGMTPEKVKAEVLYSGTINDTMSWSVDSEGLLTITGSSKGREEIEEWPWVEYAEEITSAKATVTGLTDMTGMFSDLWLLEKIDVSGMDTSQVTSMNGVFLGCTSLEEITGLDKWDTSQVTDMTDTFGWCTVLTGLEISEWNTGKVIYMDWMFEYCKSLEELDLNKWDTGSLINAYGLFCECNSLTSLKISDWDVSSLVDAGRMFDGCSNLTNLDVSKWDVSAVEWASCMFAGCTELKQLDLSKWKLNSLCELVEMFQNCKNLSTDITLTSMPQYCMDCFSGAATEEGAAITVTYRDPCSYVAAAFIVSTKSEDSNVTLSNNPGSAEVLYSGKDNNISWSIDNYGKLVLTGSGDCEDEPDWLQYRGNISTAEIKVKNMTNASGLFSNCTFLTEVDTDEWDTSMITDMSALFSDCCALEYIDVSGWNMGKVEYISYMFSSCESITALATENWDTSSIVNMDYAFSWCYRLICRFPILSNRIENVECAFNRAGNLYGGVFLVQGEHCSDELIQEFLDIGYVYLLEDGLEIYNLVFDKDGVGHLYLNGLKAEDYTGRVLIGDTEYWQIEKGIATEHLQYVVNICNNFGKDNKVTSYTVEIGEEFYLYDWLYSDEVLGNKDYLIKSFNTKADGSGKTYDVNEPIIPEDKGELTLYAQWKVNPYAEVTGLYFESDGFGAYYKKGEIDTTYTGLVQNHDGSDWWMVEKGEVTYTYTGLVSYNNAWWYVEDSKLDFNYTGLVKRNNSWFYVKNGKVDFGYTGLCKRNGSWFYVKSGVVDFTYTGLCKNNGSWFYVKGGVLNWNYTGLCKHNGSWFYVDKGVVNFNYTGLCKHNGSWFYVKKGAVNFGYTGLCKHNGSWFYVKGGVLNWNYTGLCKYNGNWYYVKNGILNWGYTGLCKYNGSWFYVKGGVLNWNYTGLCKHNGSWFYVEKGVVNFNYTGYTTYNGSRWYVKNGVMVKKA